MAIFCVNLAHRKDAVYTLVNELIKVSAENTTLRDAILVQEVTIKKLQHSLSLETAMHITLERSVMDAQAQTNELEKTVQTLKLARVDLNTKFVETENTLWKAQERIAEIDNPSRGCFGTEP